MAEEKVIFPAVAARGCPAIYEECGHGEVRAREWGPFFYMSRVLAEVQSLVRRRVQDDLLQARLKGLVEGLHDIRNEMIKHMKEEEAALVPRVRELFKTVPEQCGLMWTSLKVMPMRLLRQALPWISLKLSEQQVQSMFHFLRVGAPKDDANLVEDLISIVQKRRVSSFECSADITSCKGSDGCITASGAKKRMWVPEGTLHATNGGPAK